MVVVTLPHPPPTPPSLLAHTHTRHLTLTKLLRLYRFSHVCGEPELTWVQFLNGAVDHNLQRARELIQQDS